jgi:hypothetical protein
MLTIPVFLSVMVFLPTRYIYITRYPHRKLLHYVGTLVLSTSE